MEITREPAVDSPEPARALTLKEFSSHHHITEDRVWEMIEEGQLSARFVQDTILIFREPEVAAAPLPQLDIDPNREPAKTQEDQNEMLLFAQDSIARTVELSHQLLATKDELLRLKDEKLGFLEQTIQSKNLEIRQLKRELENMQILQKISQQPQLLRPLLDGPEDV